MIKKFVYNNMITRYLKQHNISKDDYEIFSMSNGNYKIKYSNINYNIKVIKERKKYYLFLEPYHNSFFKTSINIKELNMKLNMTLFAIKENEKLYGYKKVKAEKKNNGRNIKKRSK